MKFSNGLTENNTIIGNNYNKYYSKNPLEKMLMKRYEYSLNSLIKIINPSNIHEVGCGEGYWVIQWAQQGYKVRGSDFSTTIIDIARTNARKNNLMESLFQVCNIYDLKQDRDKAELVVCCEVLEHLDNPNEALRILKTLSDPYLILSVPREPIWRMMNIVRGKYITDFGNTPGHIQGWSKNGFIELVSRYFNIQKVLSPLPWTMLLCSK